MLPALHWLNNFNCSHSNVKVDGMPKNVSFIANCAFIIGEIDIITQQ